MDWNAVFFQWMKLKIIVNKNVNISSTKTTCVHMYNPHTCLLYILSTLYTCTTRIPVYSTSCLHCTLYSLYTCLLYILSTLYTCTTRIPVYSTSCLHCTLYSLYSKVYCIVLHCRCYDDMFITCECRWTVDWQIITHHHDNCLDHSTSPRPPSCSACRSAPRSWSTPPASARAPRSQNTVNVISTILLANTSLLWRRCLSAAAAQSYTQPSTV